MRRGQYADSGINSTVAAQMQAQRMGHYPGRMDSLRAAEEQQRQYLDSKVDAQWQWDRDGAKGPRAVKGLPLIGNLHLLKSRKPHQTFANWAETYGPIYSIRLGATTMVVLNSTELARGQGTDASRSVFQSQISDPKSGLEKQGNRDLRNELHQEDMEVGFEDDALPLTLEGLEQKFLQDIMKLAKEHEDAEDMENARHREKLNEINTQYQEKLVAVRARQATHREEFLQKESQTRHQQYQQVNMISCQNSAGSSDAHGFGSAAVAASALGDAHRAYATGHYDTYGEQQPQYSRFPRGQPRGQYPGGRAYNSGGQYY